MPVFQEMSVKTVLSDLPGTRIEPGDNFEHGVSQSSQSGFATNFDTDELIGGQFSSNNNSFENQEKMLGGPAGGIKCLRNKRTRKKQARAGKAAKHEEDKIPSGDDLVQLWGAKFVTFQTILKR